MLKPTTVLNVCTPGVSLRIASICLQTFVVRCRESRYRELNVQIEITPDSCGRKLVVACTEPARQCCKGDKQEHGKHCFANEIGAPGDVPFSQTVEHAVEAAKEGPDWSAGLLPWTQEESRERRTQGERIESGKNNRDGRRHRKLLVEPTCDPRNKGRRDEDRDQDECNRNHRTGHFFHRLQCCIVWRQSFLNVTFNRLDHDDRIVDYEADGKYKPEEREGVNRES
jgi:hypothetical protein